MENSVDPDSSVVKKRVMDMSMMSMSPSMVSMGFSVRGNKSEESRGFRRRVGTERFPKG